MIVVPLVVYKDGVRIIVGQAEVRDDGRDLVVSAKINPENLSLICASVENFSIGHSVKEQ